MSISRTDVQALAPSPTDETKDQAIADAVVDAARQEVETGGRKGFFDLRNRWSSAIIVWISILIMFNAALTVLVGLGGLDFREYHWFITAVTVETFLQIVALGAIAVRFLFSSGDTPPAP
ncbi:MAG: hypothetical protein E6G92_10370 [Alphaproteobacteria bacterium]|nr:MAG: hypothetical protein E6G92_10370 [Alphaproteobacteria bacterium]